jgi:hypothetical protein
VAFIAYLGVGTDGLILRELKTYVFIDPSSDTTRLVTAKPQAVTGQIDSRASCQSRLGMPFWVCVQLGR